MTVSMSNRIMKSKQIKTNLIKKAKPISILVPTEQIDYRSIKIGFMPNFIHSLDASNIHLLVKNMYQLNLDNINLYTIHDCFASDYKNIAIIEILVKHSFIQLYFKKNYLKNIHNSFLLQINNNFEIFEDFEKKEHFILVDKVVGKSRYKKNEVEKLYLPKLPDYNWNINKNEINKQLLFSSYFIS